MSDLSEIYSAIRRVRCCLQEQITNIEIGEVELFVDGTVIGGGSNGKLLYDNDGVIGEMDVTDIQTLYTSDGALDSDRVVNQSSHTLFFVETTQFGITDPSANNIFTIDTASQTAFLGYFYDAQSYLYLDNAGNTASFVVGSGNVGLNLTSLTATLSAGNNNILIDANNGNITLDNTNYIVFSNYGIGLNVGTATYNLAVDAGGNIIEVSSSGGNFANSDLTFDANHTHDLNGYNLTILDTSLGDTNFVIDKLLDQYIFGGASTKIDIDNFNSSIRIHAGGGLSYLGDAYASDNGTLIEVNDSTGNEYIELAANNGVGINIIPSAGDIDVASGYAVTGIPGGTDSIVINEIAQTTTINFTGGLYINSTQV